MDGGAWLTAVHGVAKSWTWLSDFTFTFHFHALEQEMATHSNVLAWRIPGTGEPGGLPSMGLQRVRHDWSDLAAAAVAAATCILKTSPWLINENKTANLLYPYTFWRAYFPTESNHCLNENFSVGDSADAGVHWPLITGLSLQFVQVFHMSQRISTQGEISSWPDYLEMLLPCREYTCGPVGLEFSHLKS